MKSLGDAPYRQRAALVLSAAVFSHFILDVIVHTPDLLIVPGFEIRVGRGLWNNIIATVVVELAILLVGCWIYIRSTPSGATSAGKYGIYAFIIALVGITVFIPFMTSQDVLMAAMTAELMYVVLTLAAWWLDSKRTSS